MNPVRLFFVAVLIFTPIASQAILTIYSWSGSVSQITNESNVTLPEWLTIGKSSSGTFTFGTDDPWSSGGIIQGGISIPGDPFFYPTEGGSQFSMWDGFEANHNLTTEISVGALTTPSLMYITGTFDQIQLAYQADLTTTGFQSVGGTSELLRITFTDKSSSLQYPDYLESLGTMDDWDEAWVTYDFTDADSNRLQIVYQIDEIAVVPESKYFSAVLSLAMLLVFLVSRHSAKGRAKRT